VLFWLIRVMETEDIHKPPVFDLLQGCVGRGVEGLVAPQPFGIAGICGFRSHAEIARPKEWLLG
jgi:hypothetical protein